MSIIWPTLTNSCCRQRAVTHKEGVRKKIQANALCENGSISIHISLFFPEKKPLSRKILNWKILHFLFSGLYDSRQGTFLPHKSVNFLLTFGLCRTSYTRSYVSNMHIWLLHWYKNVLVYQTNDMASLLKINNISYQNHS